MELRSIAEAIRCHRRIAIVGALAAVLLALVAFIRIDFANFPALERRNGPDHESTVRLFITQEGFPWGRSALRYTTEKEGQPPVLEGDPDRFATLAVLYAQIANSDQILGKVGLDGKNIIDIPEAKVVTGVVPASQFSETPLPLIDIIATHKSPEAAQSLARQTARHLRAFIAANQRGSAIPQKERVVLQVIDPAEKGRAVGGGSLTLPVLVFLTVAMLTLAVIFIRHNLEKPVAQIRSLEVAESAPAPPRAITEAPSAAAAAAAAAGQPAAVRSGGSGRWARRGSASDG
jgi:hypothetical protein